MAIVTILTAANGNSSRDWLRSLARLHEEVLSARARLAEAGFPAAELSAQHDILGKSADFMKEVLVRGAVTIEEVFRFGRDMRPRILRNAELAARQQLAQIHATVTQWREHVLSQDEWGRIYVVVLGPKMPRDGHAQYQYFERVLGAREGGRRLLYAEGISTCADALTLLGTIVLDREASEVFFGDRTRMDRDVMADGASVYLDELFGKLPQRR